MRIRYLLSGIIVPILLAGYLVGTFLAGKPKLLGLGATLMFFLVGWHYVKQGYGMAMVDAALKKQFFSGKEKTALMLNAYATWIFAWCFINRVVAEKKLLGLDVYVFPVPDLAFYASAWAAASTLLWLIFVFTKNALTEEKQYPLNGLLAYAVSLYPWMFFRDVSPVYFALVPFFHSVQYMTVVWRYEINASSAKAAPGKPQTPFWNLSKFYIIGIILGGLGFWGAPLLLTDMISYDQARFGASAFLFIFWIFINVHHYFMDNVMWRKGNPDVAKHLFGARPKNS